MTGTDKLLPRVRLESQKASAPWILAWSKGRKEGKTLLAVLGEAGKWASLYPKPSFREP